MDNIATFSYCNAFPINKIVMKPKRLEWIETEGGLIEASTPFGKYELNDMQQGVVVSFLPSSISCRRISDKRGVSLEQAKTLAQADFDAHVLACLAT